MKKQRELIEKQKLEQQKMLDTKMEEANKATADRMAEMADKVQVLDIKVDDDFEIDDI